MFKGIWEACKGFKITNGPFIFGGSASPVGLNFPTDTIYIQTSSSGDKFWRKWNSGNNDWIQLTLNDFHFYQESLGSSDTTGTGFSNKVSISTGTIPAGTYKLNATYRAQVTGLLASGNARILQDGATVLFTEALNGSLNFRSIYREIALTAGSHTFQIQFNETGVGKTTIDQATLCLERIF